MKKIVFSFFIFIGLTSTVFAGPNKATARIYDIIPGSGNSATIIVNVQYGTNVGNASLEVPVNLATTCGTQNNAIQDASRAYINSDSALGGTTQNPVNVIQERNDVRLYGGCQV